MSAYDRHGARNCWLQAIRQGSLVLFHVDATGLEDGPRVPASCACGAPSLPHRHGTFRSVTASATTGSACSHGQAILT
jgi:hypothetical protein